MSPRAAAETGAAPPRYRMRDLCERTGLERQTIHFYIQEGLLPEGTKTGRNTAYYGEEHVERLTLIRRLKDEQFLPLKAIRAVLGGKAAGFSKQQRAVLADVKARLARRPAGRALTHGQADLVAAAAMASAAGVEVRDVEELVDAGLLRGERRGGRLEVRRDGEWLVAAWRELSRAGLSRERGFVPADFGMIDEAVTELLGRERDLFFDRIGHLPAAEIAAALERAVPVLSDVLSRLFTERVRDALAVFGDDERPVAPASATAKVLDLGVFTNDRPVRTRRSS